MERKGKEGRKERRGKRGREDRIHKKQTANFNSKDCCEIGMIFTILCFGATPGDAKG